MIYSNFITQNKECGILLENPSIFSGRTTEEEIKIVENNIIANGNPYGNSYHYNIVCNISAIYNWIINATNNYWGTNDLEIIAESIYDQSDNPDNCKVLFEPYLNNPAPPAPIPELSTILLVSLGLTAITLRRKL